MATLAQLKTQAGTAGTEQKKKLRRTVTLGVSGVIGAAAFLLVTYWVAAGLSSPSTQQEAARTDPAAQTRLAAPVVPQAANCDGTQRTYSLSGAGSLINNGAHCELVSWGRDAEVVVYGSGAQKAFPAGSGGDFAFRATHWKCSGTSSCIVAAIFCPPQHTWDDVRKVCRPPRSA